MNPISEKEFQATVREAAEALGWKVLVTYRSTRSPKGEPDLRLIRPPRLIFAELKSGKGVLSAEQKYVIKLLLQCQGVETYIWLPQDWETIVSILR